MTTAEVLKLLRQSWWLIIAIALLSGGAAFGLTRLQAKVYQAEATILVARAPQPGGQVSLQDIQASQSLTRTYASLVTSREALSLALPKLGGTSLAVDDLESQVEADPIRDTQLITISVEDTDPVRAARIANAVAEAFPEYLDRVRTGQTGAGLSLDPVVVARRAAPPEGPVRPSVPLNTALGVIAGLVLGGVAGLARLRYDDRIRARGDLAQLDVPALGVISHARPGKGRRKGWRPVLTYQRLGTEFEDSCRQVAASLAYALAATDARVIAVTSASPGEGKSVTAANLALLMAEAGRRVLLVDGDLRKPDVHNIFGLNERAGLSTAFIIEGSEAGSLMVEVAERLHVIVAGPTPPSPAQVIGSPRMANLVTSLRAAADLVVIDTAPVVGLADTVLWLDRVDAAILVVRAGKTRLADLDAAARIIYDAHRVLLGVVVNDARSQRAIASKYYGPRKG